MGSRCVERRGFVDNDGEIISMKVFVGHLTKSSHTLQVICRNLCLLKYVHVRIHLLYKDFHFNNPVFQKFKHLEISKRFNKRVQMVKGDLYIPLLRSVEWLYHLTV